MVPAISKKREKQSLKCCNNHDIVGHLGFNQWIYMNVDEFMKSFKYVKYYYIQI